MRSLKVCCLSDTHDQHDSLILPDGDILLHAGDATMNGTKQQLTNFVIWLVKQPYKHKIWVAGNHDWGMEYDQAAYESWCGRRKREVKELAFTRRAITQLCYENNIHYLNNNGVEIDGLKIWGSPDQPAFCGWAFNRSHNFLDEHWKTVPDDTNILITHAPAKGILDQLETGDSVGDEALYNRIQELTNLKLHLCGHIHPGYGTLQIGNTIHANGAILDDRYKVVNKPITIEL